jgi:hypothetical protein
VLPVGSRLEDADDPIVLLDVLDRDDAVGAASPVPTVASGRRPIRTLPTTLSSTGHAGDASRASEARIA